MPRENPDDILTPVEAAGRLRVSVAQLRRIDEHLQPVWPGRPDARQGKGKRYLKSRVDGYIERLAQPSPEKDTPAYPPASRAADELKRRLG